MTNKKIIFVTEQNGDRTSREMLSTIEQASRLMGLPLEVVNADEDPESMAKLGVTQLPTTILMGPEIEITRFSGSYWLTKILDKLDF